LTLLDPACGSGAFPIGALQKIIYILEQIDGNGVLLLDNRIEAHEGTAQDNILDVSNRPSGSLNYIRKLRVIQNTLFGVDIQPVAIEISKIRCFISLIIEESIDDSKPNRDIIPLPNLDFKFVVANSLISLSEDYEIIHSEKTDNCLERLKSLRKQFFSQSNINNQLVLAEFLNEGSEILKEQQRLGNKSADLERLTSWLPFAYLKNEWVDFEWMLGTSKFDLIIGNPPYIHIERMSRAEKSNFLRQVSDIRGKFRTVPRYKTLESRGDVYCLFYEQGINLLKDDGFLIYITSNKWMTSTYGEKLRNLFLEYTNPISFVDLGSGRFSSAAVDTAILLLQNCPNLHQLKAVTYRGTNLNQLYKYVDTSFNVDFELGQPWTILDNMDRIIKEKIDSCATPLSKLNLKLHRGILTGYNDAFIISGVTREKILEKCSSETDRNKTASIMRPVLRGRNINRGSYNWGGEYLIVTHNGYPTEDGDYIPPIDINEYPALKKHFDIYFDQLSIRLDKGKTPYNLRNCLYMADFDKPKLFWSEIAQKPSFAFSNENIMIVNSCFMITNPPIGLVDILNSKLIEWYFPKIATSIGNSVAICYFKSFVQNIPIPLKIEEKRYSEDEIFELYGLNSDEISYVLESLGEYS
jgi:hypothetical protein